MTLKIDIDEKSLKVIEKFEFRLMFIDRYFPNLVERYGVHKSRKGYHVRVMLTREIRNRDAIVFQSLLLDDWLRTLRCLWRVSSGDKDWNILFAYKKKGVTIMDERFLYSRSIRQLRKGWYFEHGRLYKRNRRRD